MQLFTTSLYSVFIAFMQIGCCKTVSHSVTLQNTYK